MRLISGLFAVATMILVSSGAVAQETARAVIDRAMKARCEKVEMLAKQKIEIISMEGKIDLKTENAEVTTSKREFQVEWPKRFRFNYQLNLPNGKQRQTLLVLNGDKGWRSSGINQPAVEMSEIGMDEMKMEIHGLWTTTLYPLVEKGFTLSLLQPTKFNGEDVSVVKAVMRFRPDVYLFFSKTSGHLLKAGYKAREGGVELRKEHVISDYKSFDGMNLPSKWIDYNDGNKAGEWTIVSYKFVDKLGDEVFAKPEKK